MIQDNNLPINKESPNKDLNLEDIDEDEVTQLCDDELDEWEKDTKKYET